MIHLGALPGTPFSKKGLNEIVERAAAEAVVYAKAKFDALIVENMHDRPYVNAPHGPEIVAAMTRAGLAVREAAPKVVLGVQVLSGGHMEAMAVAQAVGAAFVRVENFVFAHIADEGLMATACAGELLRYRRRIGADRGGVGRIAIYADIKKKHASHAMTADLSVGEMAKAAAFFGADGVIVTGTSTGEATATEDVEAARSALGNGMPVLVGSGVRPEQVAGLLKQADALIVGSYVKRGGVWTGAVDMGRCKEVARARGASRK